MRNVQKKEAWGSLHIPTHAMALVQGPFVVKKVELTSGRAGMHYGTCMPRPDVPATLYDSCLLSSFNTTVFTRGRMPLLHVQRGMHMCPFLVTQPSSSSYLGR